MTDPSKVRTLGVLTSGGDCAGLNAVIRAVVLHATQRYGMRVVGIMGGTQGLIENPPRSCELKSAKLDAGLLREGGTFLGTTSKGDPFAWPMPDGSVRDRSPDFAAGVRALGLDALVVVGGDGSMRIVSRLCRSAGIGMIGVPKTIDNDVHCTEYSVGFATAINVVTEALDRLQPTAESHSRVMILEVMGRDTGHIALNGGIAGGADIILIPELRYTIEGVAARIAQVRAEGRTHTLVVVAEGVRKPDGEPVMVARPGGDLRYGGIGPWLAEEVAQASGAETRVTVLGHVQRGGTPSPRDRLLASSFGVRAVQLAAEGKFDRMVAWQDRGVIDVPLSNVTTGARTVRPDDPLLQAARGLGIYVGESA